MFDYILTLQILAGLIGSGAIGLLFKDAVVLYKSITKAYEDKKFTEAEIHTIVTNAGIMIRGVTRIFRVFRP